MKLLLALPLLLACHASPPTPATPPTLTPGTYSVADYGYLLDVRAESTDLYDVLASDCTFHATLTPAETTAWFGIPEPGQALTLRSGLTRFELTRTSLPARCTRDPDPTPLRSFDAFVATFARHYAELGERSPDWSTRVPALRARVAAGEDLFTVLGELVAGLGDPHVSLSDGSRELPEAPVRDACRDEAGQPLPRRALQRGLHDWLIGEATPLRAPAVAAGENRVWTGWLSEDVAYVAVFAMGGYRAGRSEDDGPEVHGRDARAVFAEVAGELAGARAVVVDLRFNQGGFDSVSLALVERFLRAPLTVFSKSAAIDGVARPSYPITLAPASGPRFPERALVLVGPYTVSAGDSAALAFRAIPGATLLGGPTSGALSDALPRRLPNGWEFTLANEVYVGHDGVRAGPRGIPPHDDVSASRPPGLEGCVRHEVTLAVDRLRR